ncbi:unnamed protein product, partial [Brenthis ino]
MNKSVTTSKSFSVVASNRTLTGYRKMETITHHPLLIVTPEEMKKVRQFFNLDDVYRIRESLEAIEEWCKKQDHLVTAFQYLNRSMLERLLLLSRGSTEGTKTKIDKLFTMRAMMPEICLNKTIEEFEHFSDCILYVPLPNLCPSDQSRVTVTQPLAGKLDEFNVLSYIRYCFLIGEYRLSYDYCISERFILDLQNINMNFLTKLNPIILKKGEIICTEAYGTKIKGIHIINAPSFVDKFVFVLKQGLKEKVASRLYVHNSYEDLHKEIPKQILPKEYGGDGPSCEKLADQWKDCLKSKEARRVIDECNKLVADESKRSEMKFNEEYLGMPGSFRKLTVD